MNYLIVTPDGVGSTFLQRAITLILYLKNEDVINSHEILNGIELKDQKLIRFIKANYNQSIDEIKEVLSNTNNNYIVSRLAKYHLDNRNENAHECEKLFKFLNSFFSKVIVCKRKNIFEYALSWGLRHQTGYLNVFSLKQKREVRINHTVDLNFFNQKLIDYKNYINWIEQFFPKATEIYYEDLIDDPNTSLLKLNIDATIFEKHFNMSLKEFIKLEYDLHEKAFLNQINKSNKNEIKRVSKIKKCFFKMHQLGIIPAGTMPIKNTSLQTKKNIILNYNECLENYRNFSRMNNWIDQTIVEYDFWTKKQL